MKNVFSKAQLCSVQLKPGELSERAELNRKYMMSLENENLLQNFYLEAGLLSVNQKPEHMHCILVGKAMRSRSKGILITRSDFPGSASGKLFFPWSMNYKFPSSNRNGHVIYLNHGV
jgi:hypothetical protein